MWYVFLSIAFGMALFTVGLVCVSAVMHKMSQALGIVDGDDDVWDGPAGWGNTPPGQRMSDEA